MQRMPELLLNLIFFDQLLNAHFLSDDDQLWFYIYFVHGKHVHMIETSSVFMDSRSINNNSAFLTPWTNPPA